MESEVTTQGVENTPQIQPKQHFRAKVLKVSLAGAAVDLGIGQPAFLHISQIQPLDDEPIKRVSDVLQEGQEIDVWVKRVKEGRIEVTTFKPRDLEWRDLKKGMVVKGKVVRLEKFGAFVEIGAERPALLHISEMAHGYVREPSEVVKEGNEIEAQVIDFNRKKRQIKLSRKALLPEPVKEEEPIQAFIEAPKRERPKDRDKDKEKDKEKAQRRKKAKAPRSREEDTINVDALLESLGEEPQPEVETAMAIAWREAMERAKARKAEEKGRKKAASQEQEDILARTLENKVQTS